MKNLILIIIAVLAFAISSCLKSNSQYGSEIDSAEKLIQSHTDSALSILESIDPSEIQVDSLRAKYNYLLAYGHMCRNRSMIGDSLISYAHKYYSGKDVFLK